MSKYLRERNNGEQRWAAISTALIGIAFIIAGLYIDIAYLEFLPVHPKIVIYFLVILGSSCLVTSLTFGMILKESKANLKEALENSIDEIQGVQVDFLKRAFSVTGQSLAYHLKDILAPRYTLVTNADGQQAIEPNLKTFTKLANYITTYVKEFIYEPKDKGKERRIIIQGITLKDLVDPGNPLSNAINNVIKDLSLESKKHTLGNRRVVIKALILTPSSEAVNQRRTLHRKSASPAAGSKTQSADTSSPPQEIVSPKEDRLRKDIEYSIRAFKNLSHVIETKNPSVSLELKQTPILPSAYFIMTDEYIFIEPYTLAREQLGNDERCVIGLVPILQFGRDSAMYTYFRRHFEFLWEIDNNKEQNRIYRVERLI